METFSAPSIAGVLHGLMESKIPPVQLRHVSQWQAEISYCWPSLLAGREYDTAPQAHFPVKAIWVNDGRYVRENESVLVVRLSNVRQRRDVTPHDASSVPGSSISGSQKYLFVDSPSFAIETDSGSSTIERGNSRNFCSGSIDCTRGNCFCLLCNIYVVAAHCQYDEYKVLWLLFPLLRAWHFCRPHRITRVFLKSKPRKQTHKRVLVKFLGWHQL